MLESPRHASWTHEEQDLCASFRTDGEIGRAPVPTSGAAEVSVQPPPARRRHSPHRLRALLALGALIFVIMLWWGSGYLVAYTDDAYVDSDVVSVTPEVAGPTETVDVRDNQWVERGSLLFAIDPTPFRLQLQQAIAQEREAQAQLPIDEAAIESLQAQVQVADEAARLAAITLRRVKPLSETNDVPLQTFDNARIAEEESVARERNAEAALERARQTFRLHQVAVATAHAARLYAQWRLSRTRVLAPVDGSVTNLDLAPGDMLSPNHAAMAIVDAKSWRVIANYKEYYLRHLRPGSTVWVWLDSRPWHLYRARVQGIAHAITREQGADTLVPYVSPTVDWIRLARRIPVRLELLHPPPAEELFMGADARVLAFY